jgi:allantoin racemase
MKKRIAIVAPGGIDLKDEMIRGVIKDLFLKNASKLKEDDTVLDFFMMQKGFVEMDAFSWEALNLWNSYEFFEVVRGLKGKGYDAIVSHCFGDPNLYPMRQVMDIPVVGAFENSLFFAHMMGLKIGIVTFSKYIVPAMEAVLLRYGCRDWVVSFKSTESSKDDFVEMMFDAKRIIEVFVERSRECISEGAEVIIPGCTIISPAITIARGCEKDYAHGLREVDGVPIVDVISAAVRMAEVMASMKGYGMPWISRACTFNMPPESIMKSTVDLFPYHGSGEQKY